MKSFLFIFILFIFVLYSLPGNAARPSPEKATQEILNDIYVDTPGSEAIRVQASLDPAGLATAGNQVTGNGYLASIASGIGALTQASGTLVNFASSNILDSAYTDVFSSSTEAMKFALITQNGGGDFYLRVNTTDVGYIYPGQSAYVPMILATGDVVRIKSVSGSVTSGKLYINFYK